MSGPFFYLFHYGATFIFGLNINDLQPHPLGSKVFHDAIQIAGANELKLNPFSSGLNFAKNVQPVGSVSVARTPDPLDGIQLSNFQETVEMVQAAWSVEMVK